MAQALAKRPRNFDSAEIEALVDTLSVTAPDRGRPAAGATASSELPVRDRTRYEFVGELARGGLGRILEAHDRELDRQVAVKELLRHDHTSHARLEREAKITARLQHPAIVPVHEAGRWPNGDPFYAMKLVAGRSLSEVVEETTTFAERVALLPNILAVAEAIAYAHSRRIIHRDLKPSNILIGPFGETVVIDWGLAKDLADLNDPGEPMAGPYRSATRGGLTVAGTIVGTPAYMPPEQAAGEAVDERADVYALGVILYRTLTGAAPFHADGNSAILDAVRAGPPVPLAAVEPRIPPDLAAVVEKAMARSAADRYRSARELAADLQRFLTGRLVEAHLYSAGELFRRWLRRNLLAASVAAAATVVLAAGGFLFVQRLRHERDRARSASQQLVLRSNDQLLAHAEALLHEDPTAAVALLGLYPEDGADWRRVRQLAADAVRSGIASHVLRAGPGRSFSRLAYSRDGRTIAAADENGVSVWTTEGRLLGTAPTRRRSLAYTVVPLAAGFAASYADGTVLVVDAEGAARALHACGENASDALFDLAAAPDGKALVAGSASGRLCSWSDADRPPRVAQGNRSGIYEVDFVSPTSAVAVDGAGGLSRWELATGESSTAFRAAQPFYCASVRRPDGLIAAGGADGSVRLIDRAGRLVRTIAAHKGRLLQLQFSGDGSQLLSLDASGEVGVWDVLSGAGRRLALSGTSLSACPGGRLAAASGERGEVTILDLPAQEQTTLHGHGGRVLEVAFAADCRAVATASADGTVRTWSLDILPEAVLVARGAPAYGLQFDAEGERILTTSTDGSVSLFGIDDRSQRLVATCAGLPVARFLPGGGIVSACDSASIRISSDGGGADVVIRAQDGAGAQLSDLVVAADGSAAFTGDRSGRVQRWDLARREARELRAEKSPIARLLLCRPGYLTAATVDGRLISTDLGSGAEVERNLPGGIQDVKCLDGDTIAAGGDGVVWLWNSRANEVARRKLHVGPVSNLQSLGGQGWVASASEDGSIAVWTRAGRVVARLQAAASPIVRVAPSPAGAFLAAGSADGSVRIWDLRDATSLRLGAHEGEASSVAFSADGRWFASTGSDGRLHLWRVASNAFPPPDRGALKLWLRAQTDEIPPDEWRL